MVVFEDGTKMHDLWYLRADFYDKRNRDIDFYAGEPIKVLVPKRKALVGTLCLEVPKIKVGNDYYLLDELLVAWNAEGKYRKKLSYAEGTDPWLPKFNKDFSYANAKYSAELDGISKRVSYLKYPFKLVSPDFKGEYEDLPYYSMPYFETYFPQVVLTEGAKPSYDSVQVGDVVPFSLEYALDEEHGAIRRMGKNNNLRASETFARGKYAKAEVVRKVKGRDLTLWDEGYHLSDNFYRQNTLVLRYVDAGKFSGELIEVDQTLFDLGQELYAICKNSEYAGEM